MKYIRSFALSLLVFGLYLALLYSEKISSLNPDSSFQEKIHFFGREFPSDDFRFLQSHFNEIFSEGQFVNVWEAFGESYVPLFWRPCIYEYRYHVLRWMFGNCSDSEHNRGNIYAWKPNKRLHFSHSKHHHFRSNTSFYQQHKFQHEGFLHQFSSDQLCRLMNGRNIAFIGDSLNDEMHLTLISAMMRDLHIPNIYGNNTDYINTKRKRQQDYCDGFCHHPLYSQGACREFVIDCGIYPSFKSFFWASTHLNPSETDSMTFFKESIDKNISLIILNSGAWYQPTDELLTNTELFLKELWKIHPNVSIIFRTSSPGHPRCESLEHSKPIHLNFTENPVHLNYDFYDFSDDLTKPKSFHYSDFINQSNHVVELIKTKFKNAPIMVLNVHNSTSRRVDSHCISDGDCLHYCLPGPINVWVEFLFHMLVQLDHYDVNHYHLKNPYVKVTMMKSELSESYNILLPLYHPDATPSLILTDDMIFQAHGSPGFIVPDFSYYLWDKGRKHRINESEIMLRNLSINDMKQISQWEYIQIPIGKPISP